MSLSIIGTLFGDYVVIWAAITVAAFIFFNRKRERAERFMVIGASLKLMSHLLAIPYYLIFHRLVIEGNDITLGANLNIVSSVLLGLIGMAGIICIFYGFWIKFQEKQEARKSNVNDDSKIIDRDKALGKAV